MASAAQIEANRLNAAASSGPTSPEGKGRSSRNHLKFGLFSTRNCVRPEETREYTRLSKALWKDLHPIGPVEEMLAVEIVRAAWRLHCCAVAEAEDGDSPATQAAVDRARAAAHASMRRLLNDLRQFQSDRWLRAEVLRDGFDEAYFGIADTHRVIKGLADNERLKSQFLMSPIGIDPMNRNAPPAEPATTIQTQSTEPVGPALSPVNPSGRGRQPVAAVRTIQTQSANPVGHPGCGLIPRAPRPVKSPTPDPRQLTPDQAIPRSAPCPCNSGLKFKRCCGTAARPALTSSGHAGQTDRPRGDCQSAHRHDDGSAPEQGLERDITGIYPMMEGRRGFQAWATILVFQA